jgi:NADP-dependent aldehyde dehydrogenase
VCDPSDSVDFAKEVSDAIEGAELPPMVHKNIQKQYDKQLRKINEGEQVDALFFAKSCKAAVGLVQASKFLTDSSLADEVFGPFTLVVKCKSNDEMLKVAASMEGQLTTTILGENSDQEVSKKLLSKLQSKVGRILFQGVPTGVAVTQPMQHGGPYPASTDSRFSSVGTDSIYRWLRPVAFQDCPNELLPDALKNENPLGLERKIDGRIISSAL